MRILIDIGHPAHVHLFKNFAWEMLRRNHEILFTTRDKEHELRLLNVYGFKFKSFGKHYNTKVGKVFGLLEFNFKMLKTAINFKPDIYLSHGSMYAAQIAWLMHKPHISLEDTANMEQVYLYRPFTKAILTPITLYKELGPKQIKLETYHELAYLNPAYFKKSPDVLKLLNLNPYDRYCLIRLVSWNATHDIGKKGISDKVLTSILSYTSSRIKVFISSEKNLPPELQKYKLDLSPEIIHNVIAFSSIVISEGATLAAEAGFLGVPTIYVNPQLTCNNKELEEAGCVFNFKDGTGVLEKTKEIIDDLTIKSSSLVKSSNLINKKINLTAFIVWFIENYPLSFKTMKENPEYQDRFK